MENDTAEKYQIKYMLLVKEFIGEVEKGTSWPELKSLVREMKDVDHCIRCIEELCLLNTDNRLRA